MGLLDKLSKIWRGDKETMYELVTYKLYSTTRQQYDSLEAAVRQFTADLGAGLARSAEVKLSGSILVKFERNRGVVEITTYSTEARDYFLKYKSNIIRVVLL